MLLSSLELIPIAAQIELLQPITLENLNELYVFHKPGFVKNKTRGYVTSFSASLSKHEGLSLRHYFIEQGLDSQFSVDEMIPFGRLDKDTSGLLLIAKRNKYPKWLDQLLLNPNFKKEQGKTSKVYRAEVMGIVTAAKLEELGTIQISGKLATRRDVHAERAKVISVSEEARQARTSTVEVEIDEGKHHQVKKMLSAIGHPVYRGGLHRLKLGVLTLRTSDQVNAEGMSEGQIRPLFLSEKNWIVELYNKWLAGERERLQLR